MHSVSKKQVRINLGEADQIPEPEWTRREILKVISAAGVGSAVFGRALLAQVAEQGTVTVEMIRQAEWITGMEFSDQERELMLRRVSGNLDRYAELREVPLDPEVPPALAFDPAPWAGNVARGPNGAVEISESAARRRPDSSEDLAFATVTELAALVRTRQVSSVELTRLYLDRLRRYDPVLHCVITYTEELALNQAEKADREIAAGRYRGPLHGIPWGAKDNLAVPGYRTTWGVMPDQVLSQKATVAARLEEAGAVLVAKLSKGHPGGDVWFGGQTRNPWNPERGSGGSSAGSAAATAAGLVGFSIGTEARGSIVWPSRNCGVTGLRPTFGRVSLYGTAPGGWSTRKVGPIARSVEDCALVLHAIHGADGLDPSAVDRPFHWPLRRDVRSLRVGYVESLFELDRTESFETEELEFKAAQREWQELNWRTLEVLRELGIELIPINLPNRYPLNAALSVILNAESATGFDELTRSGRDDLLVRGPNAGILGGQLIPAVEYIRANRIRTLVMEEMERLMSEVDVYVSPSGTEDSDISHTNLTGHPAVVLPNGYGFREISRSYGVNGIMFTGKLYGETELLALAHAYQQATDFHLRRPPLQEP